MIRDPVLPGVNPDLSVGRMGEDDDLATSPFEWYPGVQVVHARDLVNRRPLIWAGGPDLYAAVMSDAGRRGEHASFTGAFVGMFAMDLTGQGRVACFDRFGYWPEE